MTNPVFDKRIKTHCDFDDGNYFSSYNDNKSYIILAATPLIARDYKHPYRFILYRRFGSNRQWYVRKEYFSVSFLQDGSIIFTHANFDNVEIFDSLEDAQVRCKELATSL